ncbi:hypothetical protein, unknown function [Leishmania tarentolae]|uniref:Ubiquitin-like domain-containing protein n=1 Tax=Leishmania tarentolae TaxID=5689 RepID=A0A640KIM3_LEITA|nr:hypothetical protein, unknown function [Leishmania tarentolae]
MRVTIKWSVTGRRSVIEDSDAILSPDTTLAELKGLIQMRFGFSANELLLMLDHVLENTATLRSLNIMGQPCDPVLTAYAVRASALEISNLDQDDTSKDDDLHEFSHADLILAKKMLGKDVPVPDDRLVAMRLNAPRQRPVFLNAQREGEDDTAGPERFPQPPPGMPGVVGCDILAYDPKRTDVYQIISRVKYGPRKEGVDTEFAVEYPGIAEPFPFWDMRTPDPLARIDGQCTPGEVCLELFYFGEFDAVKDQSEFLLVVRESLQSKAGVRLRTPLPLREAGCMYPLIAVPIVLHEMDAMELGGILFEDFGKVESFRPLKGNDDSGKVAGRGGLGCASQ